MPPKKDTTQLDTGSPGFEIPEKNNGTSYTYDVGDPDREQGVIFVTNKGNMSVDDNNPQKKDISKFTRKVLADYIGIKTRHNYYPLDSDVDESFSTVKITVEGTGNKGDKTPIIGNISNTKHYPKPNTQASVVPTYAGTVESSPSLRGWRNNPLANDNVKYNPPNVRLTRLVKGKSVDVTGYDVNGNELLQQVRRNDLGTIGAYTKSVLNNNRFSGLDNDNRFAPFMGPEAMTNAENLLNAEDARKTFNPKIYNPKYRDFNMGKMAQVGIALSTRASLEIGSGDEGLNPSSGLSELKAIVPSLNQLGIASVDTTSLQPEDVLRNLSWERVENYVDISSKSWGTLNNVHDQYSGLSALGIRALSIALVVAMIILIETISLIPLGGGGTIRHYGGRFFSGRSSVSKDTDGALSFSDFTSISKLLGINSTVAPYDVAVKKGISAFFGFDDSKGLFKTVTLDSIVGSTLKSSDEYPGYSAATARAVIRSIATIIDAISKIKGPNLVSSIKNFLSLIELLRSSKLISTLKVFSSLGDQLLLDKNEIVPQIFPDEPIRKSKIDRLTDDSPGTSTSKSRLAFGTNLKLAWASNRANSLYMLPNSISILQPALSDLGAFQNGSLENEENSKTRYVIKGQKGKQKRISYDIDDPKNPENSVEGMEDAIESSDTIPMYFHDLRTNEIISFHAFLDSFSDSFQPTYETFEGFGRIEPVRIYKNTTRKIDISFHVISTSENDFNDMWIKINKLVTLVYPQYTEGRWLEYKNTGYKFTQPFSQMIGAAPMIRFRLGNLIASNYSRFGLARLFGANLNGTTFGERFANLENVDAKTIIENYQKKIKSVYENASAAASAEYLWVLTGGDAVKNESSVNIPIPLSPSKDSNEPLPYSSGDSKYTQYIPVKIIGKSLNDNKWLLIKPQFPTSEFLSYQGIKSKNVQNDIITAFTDKKKYFEVFNSTYWVSIEQLALSGVTKSKIYNEIVSGASVDAGDNFGEYIKNMFEFLDVEKNALVKSFKSTAGKGMAGFIDNLSFDWGGTSAKWEIKPNARAPQTCKVTFSFQPIHDITPGLDSEGYNRAPVYPIGQYTHGKDRLKPR